MKSCSACSSNLEQGNERFCPHCGEKLTETRSSEKVNLDCSLQVNMKYEEVINTTIENPSAFRVSDAVLEFHPFYVFDYQLNTKRKDPSGKNHEIQNQGKHIIDALNGQLVSPTTSIRFKLRSLTFMTRKKNTEDQELLSSEREKNQIIKDLINIEPIYNNIINLSGDYRVDIVDDRASLTASEKAVLNKIKQDNTTEISYAVRKNKDKLKKKKMKIIPNYSEIKMKVRYLVYVPIWLITFRAGKMAYRRKALPASSTILIDEIALCPKHFSFGKILVGRKQTNAVCEICGGAFCTDHIFKVGNSCYCDEHKPTNLLT